MVDTESKSRGRTIRLTLAGAMLAVVVIAFVLAALVRVRSPNIRLFSILSGLSVIALLAAFIFARGRRGPAGAFAFGFGLSGTAYLATFLLGLSSMGQDEWLFYASPGDMTRVLVAWAAHRIEPAPISLPVGTVLTDAQNRADEAWNGRHEALVSLLQLVFLWLVSGIGGLFAMIVRPKVQDGHEVPG